MHMRASLLTISRLEATMSSARLFACSFCHAKSRRNQLFCCYVCDKECCRKCLDGCQECNQDICPRCLPEHTDTEEALKLKQLMKESSERKQSTAAFVRERKEEAKKNG